MAIRVEVLSASERPALVDFFLGASLTEEMAVVCDLCICICICLFSYTNSGITHWASGMRSNLMHKIWTRETK